MDILTVSGLSYTYKGSDKPALTDIRLSVESGSRFGLFGPNGAGKSTLIRLITGVIRTETSLIRFGHNNSGNERDFRKKLGFVPQDLAFYDELSPMENLSFFGSWYGLNAGETRARSLELLEILGLSANRNKPARTFSGGMKRRLNLAIGLLHKPEILFLDEPTVGVDVQSRQAILSYLMELNQQGTTLFYTSHDLSEAESLCQSVCLIDEGHIIANGTLNDLLGTSPRNNLETVFLSLTGYQYRD